MDFGAALFSAIIAQYLFNTRNNKKDQEDDTDDADDRGFDEETGSKEGDRHDSLKIRNTSVGKSSCQ